jgi:hypothetical protein
MTPDERRALTRVLDRVERHLATQADHALYHAQTAAGYDRAFNSHGGADLAATQARRAAELAHELWALRAVLD